MNQRGSILIGALLISILMLLVGLGFLASRSRQYQSARELREAQQALALAEAGLEDFRVKMSKQFDFPPWEIDQNRFAYSEDLNTATFSGSYTVEVERQLGPAGEEVWTVTSEGLAGLRGEHISRRGLQGEVLLPATEYATLRDLGSY